MSGQAWAPPAQEAPRHTLGGRRGQRPQAAVVDRGGLQRQPQAGGGGRLRRQERAVLVRHDLAADLRLLRARAQATSSLKLHHQCKHQLRASAVCAQSALQLQNSGGSLRTLKTI